MLPQIAEREESAGGSAPEHPLDMHYRQLQSKIEPVPKGSDEYKMLEKYVRDSHGKTHHFGLKVVDIYRLARDGEEERFRPWESLHNRQLLWHGSRLTNFVGIISQGVW